MVAGQGDDIDTDGNGLLSAPEMIAVRSIDVTNMDVADLTGIECFPELEYLNCDDNQLTSLDVSNNTALTNLDCYNNQLASLDVSNNTALTNLDCHNNRLTSLNLSNNTVLT